MTVTATFRFCAERDDAGWTDMDQLCLQAVRLPSYVETCPVYLRLGVDSRWRSQAAIGQLL